MHIAVDPRLELLMTVQLASEYAETGPLVRNPFAYRDAAVELARRHADHPAAALWRALCADGFTFDAPVRFALWHTALPQLEPIEEYSAYLTHRAKGPERLRPFADALRAFAAVADFEGFLRGWRRQFERYEAQARAVIELDWPARLDAYAGRAPTQLRVLLAPLSTGSYGFWVGDVAYSVVAPSWESGRLHFDDFDHMRYLVLHEGAHSFVNDAVFRVAADFEASAALLAPIAQRMADQAYPRWITVVCEHVVRAVVARLSEEREAILAEEEARGFIYIRPVADALAEYECSRDRHPTFADFAPRIAEVLRALTADA